MKYTFLILVCTSFLSCSEKEEKKNFASSEIITPETEPAEEEPTEEPAEEEPTEEPTEEEPTEEEPTEEEPTEEPEFDICTLSQQERVEYELPAMEEEAAQLTLIPGVGETYTLTKLEGSDGWFVLDVPCWMCEVQLYTTEDVMIELQYTPDWELGEVGTAITECDDESSIIRYSWVFHAWGSYIVHIQAPENSEIWLASVMLE